MEGLLRSEEMAEIEELALAAFPPDGEYNSSSNIIFFPIRHHSPACSYHLKNLIKEYQPDCILIEGSIEANDQIPILTDEKTKSPIALYYSYKDEHGYISEEKKDYKCYYPFLDYSPELTALREGKQSNIPTAFIDLSYHEILIACREGKGLRAKKEKQNYNDDYLLSQNDYLQLLCKKQGLRCFDELWEKLFEINGKNLDIHTFVKNMLAYCLLSRKNTPQEELKEEGILTREKFMVEQIIKKQEEYQRILVVTGGFHTPGLIELLTSKTETKVQLHGKAKKCYVMAYSMEAADRLNGYASGMPFPSFYQEIWNGMNRQEDNPYEGAVLSYLLWIGQKARKKDFGISTYDEICALQMATGLSALRGKKEPGAYELYDSILSCYIKGEYNISTELPMILLQKEMTGTAIGSLGENADVPPVVLDFQVQCKQLNLKVSTTQPQEIVLDLFSSEKHQKVSRFLNQLVFLETTFGVKKKGPRLSSRKNRNLVRETWQYQWSTIVTTELIDKSVYGATVKEACASYLKEQLSDQMVDAKQGAKLLVQTFEMGLTEQFRQAVGRLTEILSKEGSFFSLVECLEYLKMAFELRQLYQMDVLNELIVMIEDCFNKILVLLPSMASVKEEDCEKAMNTCKLLFELATEKSFCVGSQNFSSVDYRKVRLIDVFETLLEKENIHPKLEGTAYGLLYGIDSSIFERILTASAGYMKGTHEKLLSTAGFLRGLFFGAKDLIFSDPSFLTMTNELIQKISNDEFMQLLPELRLAFNYFTPRETDKIAAQAASLYGENLKEFKKHKGVSPEVFQFGKELDQYAVSQL